MNKQDMMKVQPCVLRVNIHCDGCAHKVQKQLQKIEGVFKVGIDVDQGKVTVTGNVDPGTLIKKLEKSGKHAELWGGQKGSIPMNMMANQFKNFQMDNKSNGGKDGKGQKGGKGQQKGGGGGGGGGGFQLPKEMQFKNEFKDMKFPGKDKKSVKFHLPEDEEGDFDDDDYSDESDWEDDDEGFEDDFDEGFAAHQQHSKGAQFAGHGGKANKAPSDGHHKGKNGGNKGGGKGEKGGGGKGEQKGGKGEKGEKSGRFDTFLKSMLGKSGSKNGNGGNNHSKKGDKQQKEGGKKGGGFALDEGKNAAKNGKGGANHGGGGGGGGKMNEKWNKKQGDSFDGLPRMENKHHPGFNNMGMNPGMMMMGGGGGGHQMPNFQAVQGLPTGGAMNGGHFQGGGGLGQGNHHPFNNPQYMDQMRMMMMMNQQQQQQLQQQHHHHHGNGHSAYNHPQFQSHHPGYMPMMPGMSYGAPPPPGSDRYTDMFSDENTGSCSIM